MCRLILPGPCSPLLVVAFPALAMIAVPAAAAVTQLASPAEMSPAVTTLDFEGYPHLTAANTLLESSGVRFSRDDGGQTAIYNPTTVPYRAHSGTDFLATPAFDGGPDDSSTELNVEFLWPVREVGAYFGNDRNVPGFEQFTLSVFGTSGELLGSVSVPSNFNLDADQFIGLRSDVPFARARFEHHAEGWGVAIDDLTYTAIPEPTGRMGGLLLAAGLRRRRRDGPRRHNEWT